MNTAGRGGPILRQVGDVVIGQRTMGTLFRHDPAARLPEEDTHAGE
jgi:hypothetical protein